MSAAYMQAAGKRFLHFNPLIQSVLGYPRPPDARAGGTLIIGVDQMKGPDDGICQATLDGRTGETLSHL